METSPLSRSSLTGLVGKVTIDEIDFIKGASMTFSIVARCPRTGQYGVGIATYTPNVGPRCPVVVANAGAASVQAIGNPILNMLAAEMLGKGIAAKKVITELLASDPMPQMRQILVVDIYGQAHAHTGSGVALARADHVGPGYACGGNVLAGEGVVTAMAKAFEDSVEQPLAERLVRSVEAGRDAGGQPEGQTSSALLVYGPHPFPMVDLRVEVNDEPVGELRRVWDWYQPMLPFFGTYMENSFKGTLKRWWQWRQDNVPGWIPRHLR